LPDDSAAQLAARRSLCFEMIQFPSDPRAVSLVNASIISLSQSSGTYGKDSLAFVQIRTLPLASRLSGDAAPAAPRSAARKG
jgi:hypothetical protein